MTNRKRTVLNVCLLQIGICAAFAQLPSSTARCQVSTSPVQVRAEGLTERLGDIVLQCSGSVPGAVFTGNFTLSLPVSVTNRVDATIQTREAGVSVHLGSGFVPPAIAGQVSGNSISFNGISYTAPASGNVNLRISNVRAAMNQLGLTSAVPAAGTAFASTRVTEGFATAFEARTAETDTGTRFLVKYTGFPSTTRLYIPDAVAGSDALQPAGGGDLTLPQAVGQYMPGSGALVLVRVLGADATGAGGYAVAAPQGAGPVTLGSVSEVTLTNGSGYAVYEVAAANPSTQETAQFPTFISLPRFTTPAVAQETIALAPVPSVITASATAPIPRFAAVAMQSDCQIFGDCAAPVVSVPKLLLEASPIHISAVGAGGAMTSPPGSFLVHNAGGGSMAWSISVAYYPGGTGWLVFDTPSGTNEATVRVTANTRALTPGFSQADIIVNAGAAGAQSVHVDLTVTAAPVPPAPPAPVTPAVIVSQVLNAATLQVAPLVAGSLTTLMGSHLSGKSVAVTFDGTPAT